MPIYLSIYETIIHQMSGEYKFWHMKDFLPNERFWLTGNKAINQSGAMLENYIQPIMIFNTCVT